MSWIVQHHATSSCHPAAGRLQSWPGVIGNGAFCGPSVSCESSGHLVWLGTPGFLGGKAASLRFLSRVVTHATPKLVSGTSDGLRMRSEGRAVVATSMAGQAGGATDCSYERHAYSTRTPRGSGCTLRVQEDSADIAGRSRNACASFRRAAPSSVTAAAPCWSGVWLVVLSSASTPHGVP